MHNETRCLTALLAALALGIPALAADSAASTAPAKANKANYELAAQWIPAKVGKLIFDLGVTPHWLEAGDRFWYSFENNQGRKFWLVDPVKKSKSSVFDPVKLAAQLTAATGLPWDSQHLPIATIRFVKSDASIEFDVTVPRDAVIPGEKKSTAAQEKTDAANQEPQQQQGGRGGRGGAANPNQKTLTFEYELATAKLTLLDEKPARKPAWANMSPDEKWVVFVRNHNLYMMDAANYAKALKKADDKS